MRHVRQLATTSAAVATLGTSQMLSQQREKAKYTRFNITISGLAFPFVLLFLLINSAPSMRHHQRNK